MADDRLTPDRLDRMQRVGARLAPPPDMSLIAAPVDCRRLSRVAGVGVRDREWRPTARDRDEPSAGEDVLIGLYGHQLRIAFLLQHSGTEFSVALGTWQPATETTNSVAQDQAQRVATGILAGVHTAVWLANDSDVALPLWPRTGFVIGVPTPKGRDRNDGALPLDRLVRAMAGEPWAALVLAGPVPPEVLADRRRLVIEDLRRAQAVAQTSGAPSPLVEHYAELMKLSFKDLTHAQAVGAWRTAVYLLGTETSYPRLASVWTGVYSGEKSTREPVRAHEEPVAARWAIKWAMPDLSGRDGHDFEYQSVLTSSQLAAYVHLPSHETSGFRVTTVPDFDTAPPPVPGDATAVPLGEILRHARSSGVSYGLDVRALTRHAFVAGVTGAGKTNTIFVLLKAAQAQSEVPFLVIEPAKTEYRALLNDETLGNRLHVFTLGNEGTAPFRLNPFEVPAGIAVGVHIDLLRSVFSASFGLWNPLPQILERCLHQVYVDRGWDITTNTNHRGAGSASAFPTLSDLTIEVDRYLGTLNYSGEVVGNMRSALLTRLASLQIGGKGKMLDVPQSLPFDELLRTPTVLELESMGDDDDKAFVMGLVFIRLVEHWRTQGSTASLRHLLVIEEAHRLLTNVANTGRGEDANPRAKAVETFANMLSEVRAYGQGIIIADQVPVKLAPDVMKNTNLKIAHRIVDAEDRRALAGAMAMTDVQATSLATLVRGQAAVFAEGEDAPVLVQMLLAKDLPVHGRSDNGGFEGAAREADQWPDNLRVRAHMASAPLPSRHRALFLPHPGCADIATDGGRGCRVARRLAASPAFARTFARLLSASMIDMPSLYRLWPDVSFHVQPLAPAGIDTRAFVDCLLYHAVEHWGNHRGARGAWSHEDTTTLKALTRRMLMGLLEGADSLPKDHAAFVRELVRLDSTATPPFPACELLCRQPNGHYTCHYRQGAADLVTSGLLADAWRNAQNADRERTEADGHISGAERWRVCNEAGYHLAEFAADAGNAPDDEQLERIRWAAVHACLCFGQQMLVHDLLDKHPRVVMRHVDALIAAEAAEHIEERARSEAETRQTPERTENPAARPAVEERVVGTHG